jgi:nucleotide-binding universal stress UspA family protein
MGLSGKCIVVGTDFSDTARAALDWAIALARPLEARIVLAHVFDLPIVGLPDAAILVGPEIGQPALGRGAESRRADADGGSNRFVVAQDRGIEERLLLPRQVREKPLGEPLELAATLARVRHRAQA